MIHIHLGHFGVIQCRFLKLTYDIKTAPGKLEHITIFGFLGYYPLNNKHGKGILDLTYVEVTNLKVDLCLGKLLFISNKAAKLGI